MYYTLYVLRCPDTNIVRYVGITSQKLQARLYNHIHKKNDNPHKDNWIASLEKKNKIPIIEGLIYNLTESKACELEIKTIAKFRSKFGKKLTNILPGGNLPPNHKGKTRTFTAQHKRNISASCKGRKAHNKGKKMSDEQKKKLSAARKKISATPEWKALRKTWSLARIKTKLVSPQGKIYFVENVYRFCLDHQLDTSCVYKVIKGKSTNHKGWHLYGITPKKPISTIVQNSENEIFKVDCVPQFCRVHNLDQSAFYKVIRGTKNQHKGWHLV